MTSLKIILLSAVIFMSVGKSANASESQSFIDNYLQSPQVIGESRLKVLFWNVYDAKLYAPQGEFSSEGAYALSLTYLRDFEGESIASRSIDEMRDQGFSDEVKLAEWFELMKGMFPDVKEKQNITGVRSSDGTSHFYIDGEKLGSIEDKEFSAMFFGIWLNEETSQPKMRKQLLGMN
ncbi:chalcone isomerase family protein [Glaciecola sp. KUL10]|uniref:chalcone isomerase family protein n=1 Tax=Glaciecola sp. (strain KUL10) TaxID=2161813 RepID=UPI000D7874BE|nr:chalcone isomerase family protein [Glaciecola sp. KUL10]GBL05552.1 hypothetical protein KUL10_28780 [Glaciecola sp. KUL10]